MRQNLFRFIAIIFVAAALGIGIHYSFIKRALSGEIIIRPPVINGPGGNSNSSPNNENPPDQLPSPRIITLDEAKSRFDAKEAVFIDARPDLFYKIGHIAGAISFPRAEFEKTNNFTPIQEHKGKKIILYCSGKECPDSSILSQYMIREGFRDIEIFEGGWPEWEKAGYPSEKNL